MMSAHTWRRHALAIVGHARTLPEERFVRSALACAAALLLAGCQQTGWMSAGSPPPRPERIAPAPAKAKSAPAPSRPQVAPTSQTTTPGDPASQLAQEIQQYVSNLPMDDLQAKLSRHGEPVSQAAPPASAKPMPDLHEPDGAAPAGHPVSQRGPSPGNRRPVVAGADAPVITPAATANRHVPLPPEVILPSPRDGQPASGGPGPGGIMDQQPAGETAKPVPAGPGQDGNTRIVEIDISPAVLSSIPKQPASSHAVQPQTNQPAAVQPGPSDDLKELLGQLRKQAADRPDSVGAALRVRLAEWAMDSKASPEAWSLQDADKRQLAQSVWQVLQVISKMDASPQGAPPADFGKAIESLTETLEQVQPLQIPTALLCRSVSSFGCPDVMPQPWHFLAGRTSMVVLYCELAGFKSEPAPQKTDWYHTVLSQRLAILTSAGKELWSFEDQKIEDLCRRPRRDFFITKLLKIPATLPAGDYVLKVTIRDKLANHVTETNVPFAITADKT